MDRVHAGRAILGATLVMIASAAISCSSTAGGVALDESPTPATNAELETPSRPLEKARALFDDGFYSQAEALTRTVLAETEARTGQDSLETAAVIDLLVEILLWEMKDSEAETLALAQRALRIREARLDPAHPDVATSKYRLGGVWFGRSKLEPAAELTRQALALQRSAGDATRVDAARSLEQLGMIHLSGGDLDRARELLQEALDIRETALRSREPEVADSLMSLGYLAAASNDLETAERYFREALTIREEGLGPHHPKVAGALHNLGVIRQYLGDLAGARALYEQALGIRSASLDLDAPRLATSHVAVATLDQMEGDYTSARQQYRQALESYEHWVGQEHMKYAVALTQLADLDRLAGDFRMAREHSERALEIRRTLLGGTHPDIAKNLFPLGYLLLAQGDPAGAMDRFTEALAVLPESAPLKAHVRVGLALALNDQGKSERAQDLLESSIRSLGEVYGEGSRELLSPTTHLAAILLSSGDTERASSLFRQGRALAEQYLGPDHPDVGTILCGEAIALAGLDRTKEAMETALRAAGITRAHVRSTSGALSERQALAYAAHSKVSVDVVLSVLTSLPHPDGETVAGAWDAVLQSRGLVLDEMTARHRYVEESANPRVRSLARNLREVRQQLGNLLVRGSGGNDLDQYSRTVASLRSRRDELELELGLESRRFREDLGRGWPGIAEVAAALPEHAALVAYVQYDRHDPARPSKPVPAMAALVMSRTASPVVIDLGTASRVMRTVDDWRREAAMGYWIRNERREEAESAYRRVGRNLKRLVWDPLGRHLEDADLVLIVPAGSLNLVNFAALPDDSDGFLVESDPALHLLTTERDLVPKTDEAVGRGLLAIGNPDFDVSPSGPEPAVDSAPSYRGPRARCPDLHAPWGAIPETAREIEEVAALWRPDPLSTIESDEILTPSGEGFIDPLILVGADATEARFKLEARGRRVVHVGSHGFFLDDRCAPIKAGTRGIGGLAGYNEVDPTNDGDAPLRLSGLVFAGANRNVSSNDGGEDGILTAEEISTLDLRGVEWVVLSACETGLGEIQVGEGVFGLRRAFRIAGARTTIMSLWLVQDRATREWMRVLYEARHGDRSGTAESVRDATRAMLRRARADDRTTHPFFWGGFVAAGDWR